MKKYIIYQITNLLNGKIYIGKHETYNLNDGYMGSGKYLKKSIAKYGIGNFKKEILHIFEIEEDMNKKEKDLVTEEFCLRDDTYNLCPGGKGGWGYINSNKEITIPRNRKNIANENLKIKFDLEYHKLKQAKINKIKSTQSYRDKLSESCRGRIGGFTGKVHSEYTKSIMSEKASQRSLDPTKNSQYGSMWITNGTENKKIKAIDAIPEGWHKGRKINPSAPPL